MTIEEAIKARKKEGGGLVPGPPVARPPPPTADTRQTSGQGMRLGGQTRKLPSPLETKKQVVESTDSDEWDEEENEQEEANKDHVAESHVCRDDTPCKESSWNEADDHQSNQAAALASPPPAPGPKTPEEKLGA